MGVRQLITCDVCGAETEDPIAMTVFPWRMLTSSAHVDRIYLCGPSHAKEAIEHLAARDWSVGAYSTLARPEAAS